MSQAQVDEWCAELAQVHYMQIDETRYAAIPREARGVPHYTVPGMHSYLCHYTDALEHARTLLGIEDRRTIDSLQCLAFGPFTERQPPHVSELSDPTLPTRFRNPEDAVHSEGRAFQVDATCADVSIAREPLIPCVAVTSSQDNIFASCQPYLMSAFGAAALIAQLARSAYHMHCGAETRNPCEELAFLHELLVCFHTGKPLPSADCNHYVSAAVCVLLNVIFPRSTEISVDVILAAYAAAPAACAKAMSAQAAEGLPPIGCSLSEMGFAAERTEQAQTFWSAFTRRPTNFNAWVRLEPVLTLLLETDGSFDNSLLLLDSFSSAMENLVRASWYVDSPDGARAPAPPSALAGVRAATQVTREHLNPIFIGYTSAQGQHYDARGSIVGLMPMGLQHVLALLTAAAADGTTLVQYARNEGQLCYRASSAADIHTDKNRERSSKAISCVGVEGDEAAFGTRSEKMILCKLQRLAWRKNLDYVKPICLGVAKPRSEHVRARGMNRSLEPTPSRSFSAPTVAVAVTVSAA